MEDTEILSIKKSDLEGLLNHYPSIREDMKNIADQRSRKNKIAAGVAKKVNFKISADRYN